jgi:hypothetical protein
MTIKNILFAIIVVIFAAISGYICRIVTHKDTQIVNTDTIYVHSVSYDTIIQDRPVPIEVIKYVPKYTTVYKLTHVPVDTALIIAQYFEVKLYDDVLKDDSTGYVRLKEKVYQSSIIERELFFEARYQNKIITNTINPSGLYLSGSLLASKQRLGVQGNIMYLNNKKRLYGIGVGHFNSPYISLSYGFKFK